jgi:hypothetical protein
LHNGKAIKTSVIQNWRRFFVRCLAKLLWIDTMRALADLLAAFDFVGIAGATYPLDRHIKPQAAVTGGIRTTK